MHRQFQASHTCYAPVRTHSESSSSSSYHHQRRSVSCRSVFAQQSQCHPQYRSPIVAITNAQAQPTLQCDEEFTEECIYVQTSQYGRAHLLRSRVVVSSSSSDVKSNMTTRNTTKDRLRHARDESAPRRWAQSWCRCNTFNRGRQGHVAAQSLSADRIHMCVRTELHHNVVYTPLLAKARAVICKLVPLDSDQAIVGKPFVVVPKFEHLNSSSIVCAPVSP
eukprot:COSAG02_NODE_1010_length_15227_cov_5.846774_9_plen_221_part_00